MRLICVLQIEGVIADYGIGLGDLIGVITEFFSRVGMLPRRSTELAALSFRCVHAALDFARRHQGYQAQERVQSVHGALNGMLARCYGVYARISVFLLRDCALIVL